jgi:hypothetical protein
MKLPPVSSTDASFGFRIALREARPAPPQTGLLCLFSQRSAWRGLNAHELGGLIPSSFDTPNEL